MPVKWYGDRVLKDVRPDVMVLVKKKCFDIVAEAKRSIGQVPAPSPPGHAPASPTGILKGSIATEFNERELLGRAGTNLEHGLYTELGTKFMQPRPWLRPALAKVRQQS